MSMSLICLGALALVAIGVLCGLVVGKLGFIPGNGHKVTTACLIVGIIIFAALIPRLLFQKTVAALFSVSLLGGFFAGWLRNSFRQPTSAGKQS